MARPATCATPWPRRREVYTVDISNDSEMDALFVFLSDDVFKLQMDQDGKADESKQKENANATREHEWNPSFCISVPGTVYGVGYRCTCAHGAYAQSRLANASSGDGDSSKEGSWVTQLVIAGVQHASVVRKGAISWTVGAICVCVCVCVCVSERKRERVCV